MSDYIIQLKKGFVHANRIINGELELIRFAGESAIPEKVFWDNFKQKIEYAEGEKLAFAIISDDSNFQPDSELCIAEDFTHKLEDITWLVEDCCTSGATITCYPSIDLALKKPRAPREKLIEPVEEVDDFIEPLDESQKSNLQAFYRKKTRDYKREL